MKYFKTVIEIYSDWETSKASLIDIAKDAEVGESLCTRFETIEVEDLLAEEDSDTLREFFQFYQEDEDEEEYEFY